MTSTAPVAIVYEISPLGRSLEPNLGALLPWADQRRDEVLEARRVFAQALGSDE